jgi:hypothetical protein
MRKLLLILILGMVAPLAWAADDKDKDKDDDDDKNDVQHILENMGYPELQVVPRASERLKMEARIEDNTWYYSHWPILLSGLATAYTGFSANGNRKGDLRSSEKTDANTIATVTQAVGLGWMVGGVLIGAQRPYIRGERALRKHTGKDERSQLLRERLAEETFERSAKTMRVLSVVSVATNLSVSALSMVYADDQGKMVAGVAAILSFLPLMFEDHNISVHEKHIEYKKKIYAPLKSASFHYDSYSKTITPMQTLAWSF